MAVTADFISGSFSGRAIYDTGIFPAVAEDVSDLISMISPYETPLLALLGDSQYPAANVYHEWLEDELGPNTLVTSTNIASTAADTSFGIAAGLAQFLQLGMILKGPTASDDEYMQITAIAGNTITVSRGFASTSANSVAAGQSISIISDAAIDGADVMGDISRPRTRKGNYTQIFKKDVIISGTTEAVTHLGGISSEWDYQKQLRLRENLRDLEKAVILGRLSGNTIGSASARRTFSGLLEQITTNVDSWGTLSDSALTSSFRKAWDAGDSPDVIVAGDSIKRTIDQFNNVRTQTVQGTGAEGVFRNLVSVFECTYGSAPVMLNRWMPTNKYMLISSSRIKICPLQGRSFTFQDVARTGDSMKGMILGEYTLEVRNENGMVRGTVG